MDEFESPFARTPAPGVSERPSALTYEGQIAAVGELAAGLRDRRTGTRVATRLIVLLVLAAFVLSGAAVAWVSLAG